MSNPEIRKAMEAARTFLNNTEERRLYINREMARMDRESQLKNAKAEGIAEGKAEGKAEGIAEGSIKGESRMGRLAMQLVKEGKIDQLERVTSDKELRQKLYKKYGIE